MNREEIKASIEDFFVAIEGDVAPEAREARLSLALDQLAIAVHFTDYTFDDRNFPDPEVREYATLRTIVSPRFRKLGYYNVALDVSDKIGETSLGVGDAIDDICDIARDLEEVRWRWENTSVEDALWHLEFGFGSHWGKHLRDLQLYLHALEHGL